VRLFSEVAVSRTSKGRRAADRAARDCDPASQVGRGDRRVRTALAVRETKLPATIPGVFASDRITVSSGGISDQSDPFAAIRLRVTTPASDGVPSSSVAA